MRAVLVIVAAIVLAGVGYYLVSSPGKSAILVENIVASSHGGGLIGVTMDIRNEGTPDMLVSVSSPDAEMALVKSADIRGAPIPGGATVSLVMEGAHVMLGKMRGEMDEGRLIPLVLEFEQAGAIAAKARFGKMAMMHDGMAMDGMSEMGMDYPVPEGEPAPSLSLSAEARDEGWTVAVAVENFTFSREQADGPHAPGVGHGHLYVGGVKLGRVYENEATIPALPQGRHLVRVTLNTNDHRVYLVDGEPVTATVTVGE